MGDPSAGSHSVDKQPTTCCSGERRIVLETQGVHVMGFLDIGDLLTSDVETKRINQSAKQRQGILGVWTNQLMHFWLLRLALNAVQASGPYP